MSSRLIKVIIMCFALALFSCEEKLQLASQTDANQASADGELSYDEMSDEELEAKAEALELEALNSDEVMQELAVLDAEDAEDEEENTGSESNGQISALGMGNQRELIEGLLRNGGHSPDIDMLTGLLAQSPELSNVDLSVLQGLLANFNQQPVIDLDKLINGSLVGQHIDLDLVKRMFEELRRNHFMASPEFVNQFFFELISRWKQDMVDQAVTRHCAG